MFLVSNLIVQIPNRDPITLSGTSISGSNDPVDVADLNALLPLQPAGISYDPTSSIPLDLSATEDGATASFPVVLTRAPTSDVTITFSSADSDPAISSPDECSFSPNPITFTSANWFTPQAVTVTAYDDSLTEGNHTCVPIVTITGDTTYANLSPASGPTVNITDNDGAGVVFTGDNLVVSDLSAAEGSDTATLPVALRSAPTADVTATLTDPTGQCSFSPSSLTFTAANYTLYQPVTVTPVDDAIVDGAHSCTPVITLSSTDTTYSSLSPLNAPTVAIADNDQPGAPLIQGPSGDAGDGLSEKVVDEGVAAVHQFTAEDNSGTPVVGFWAISDFDDELFTINRTTGELAFVNPPPFVQGGENTYRVNVTFFYGLSGSVTQLVTIRIRDTAENALARNRDDIEQIIVDAEVTKMRAQQNALRSMTSSARDRLAGGACGGGDDEQQSGATQENQSCRIDDSDLAVDTGENGITVSGSNHTVRTFDGYRRIANVNFSVADDNNVRTLSFNGNFALENFRAEDALYGVFAGVSVNRSTVSRGLSGSADSYGLSLGAYAVNKLAESVFSEAYISIGRSQNQLELTDGYLDVAADYGTTEAHLGWILSGQIEKGDWDFLPELGIQMSRSQSSSIDVTGTIPGDTADVTWEGLTATLARANLSTDFRHYLGGRADDAWILNFKPGVVCERVDAITVTQGCGIAAGLGLNRTSADGAHRFAAELSVEEIEDIRRKGASLNYELRF